jgi:exodeoxyribonuclease V alpha subunit
LSGVAANRIKLVSGYESRTIHALLGFDGVNYSFNETNPLPYDLIVVDEAGMINADMFFYLLKAINFRRTKLFIIGYPAQLLPVGSGNVYNDLLLLNSHLFLIQKL